MRSSSRYALFTGLVVIALVFSEVSGKKEKEQRNGKSGRKSRGLWIGHEGHGHGSGGWGWMKLHNDRHHGHSTKLSEAYVKFHGLGEKGNNRGGGILGRLGNILSRLTAGRGDPDEDSSSGWGSNNDNSNNNNNNNNNGGGGWGSSGGGQAQQQVITIAVPSGPVGPPPKSGGGGGGGGGGWGPPPSMMQMQTGWSNPSMQMVVAQPTGWASAQSQQSSGGSSGGSKGGNNRPTGWASGDFSSFRPQKGSNNNNRLKKGHFDLNLPSGKPAYIQKLTPIIDLPKIALHGWRR